MNKDRVVQLSQIRTPRVRDLLIEDLRRTKGPVDEPMHAASAPVVPSSPDLIVLLRACVDAMEMRMGHETGDRHIDRSRKIWDKALDGAKAALTDHDERANDQVIDLDADAWAELKQAIERAPKFQEMYQAGGTFTDACASVRMWLEEEAPSSAMDHGI